MKRITEIKKWGNSYALRVPRAFVQMLGLRENSKLETYVDCQRIVYRNAFPKHLRTWDRVERKSFEDEAQGVPSPGDVFREANFDWIAISPLSYNRSGQVLACPVHMRSPKTVYEILVPESEPTIGAALADQLSLIDWRQPGVKYIGTLTAFTHSRVKATLRALVDPDD